MSIYGEFTVNKKHFIDLSFANFNIQENKEHAAEKVIY